ncbi:PepSY domain-containing protein [Moraxella sp.]|uniref:PepSY domain-containing protein n=1 Tax=Moraxella sp. TaxID=479 RepID=UPI0026DC0183|nr:PepSY domain-containing protein [Moraxella sp.]MDO4894611.1 PepSY domain-containing protein [Moraxella sp.]
MKKLLLSALVAISALNMPSIAHADDDDWEDRAEYRAKQTAKISSQKAKQIAVRAVGGGRVTSIDFDHDGRPHYDVEVRKGHTEYDIKIDAKTGAVIYKRIDR